MGYNVIKAISIKRWLIFFVVLISLLLSDGFKRNILVQALIYFEGVSITFQLWLVYTNALSRSWTIPVELRVFMVSIACYTSRTQNQKHLLWYLLPWFNMPWVMTFKTTKFERIKNECEKNASFCLTFLHIVFSTFFFSYFNFSFSP